MEAARERELTEPPLDAPSPDSTLSWVPIGPSPDSMYTLSGTSSRDLFLLLCCLTKGWYVYMKYTGSDYTLNIQ